METELIVEAGGNVASLDLLGDVPVSLNYLISDLKDPAKRNGAFSKTVKLPGSTTNNIFFEHTYDVNVRTQNFNPNLKTTCYVLQDSVEVFRGYLRLREIEIELVNDLQKITYEVTLLGDNQDLFGVIGDAKLQDLDMSEFDHTYNRVNQYNSWTAPLGQGYVYPLIDYGYNAFLTNSFNVEHLRPAFYAREYVRKIFAAAGKTYTSSFLDSTFFKRWIIPHNGDKFTMSAANLALYECYVGDTGLSTANSKSLSFTGGLKNDWWSGDTIWSPSSTYAMAFNDDTSNPFVDTGNIYDPLTGVVTIAQSGNYNFNFKTDFEIKFSAVPAGTASIHLADSTGWPISFKILRSTDGGVTWPAVWNDSPNYQTNVITTTYQTITKNWTWTSGLNAGDKIKVLVHPLYSTTGYGIVFKDGGGNPITTGTATMQWRFRNTATAKVALSVGDYVSGQNLVINDAIPKDIKQKDFLVSLFRMANLYVDIDPNNSNNYLIERRDDFYSAGGTKDWTDKLATNQPSSIRLMAETDIKNFIYRFKSDSDYFNKKYEDANAEPYGTHRQIVNNDFSLKDNVTEVIFSPTPLVDNSNNDIIIPKIFSYDGTNVKPQKHNIRILMFNGTEGNSPTWNYVAPSSDALGAATLPMSLYPATGMVNNALNPTESIEFGVPNMTFYSPDTYTTNNIYNREYSKEIAELTDRDARIVTHWFYLTPTDIAIFDFRDKFFVKDTLFFVIKISDYNKLKPGLTKVELLKIKNASAYEPESGISIGAISTNSTNTGMSTARYGTSPEETNIGNANNVLIGDNNSSRSVGAFVAGSRNSIGPSCYMITVIGMENNIADTARAINLVGCSGNNIGSNCSGITLINCKGVTVNDYVYDFTGTNLTNETITEAQNNTTRTGVLSTFEATGNTF